MQNRCVGIGMPKCTYLYRKRNLSKRGRIYETATENQKRLWIGEKHADEFEIIVG